MVIKDHHINENNARLTFSHMEVQFIGTSISNDLHYVSIIYAHCPPIQLSR